MRAHCGPPGPAAWLGKHKSTNLSPEPSAKLALHVNLRSMSVQGHILELPGGGGGELVETLNSNTVCGTTKGKSGQTKPGATVTAIAAATN